jgi:tetratricopeptide (TPR) repeat protein
MNSAPEQYNIAAIRNLLKDAFTADTLWRFCQERPDFQPVLVHFPYNATLAQMIDALIQYCQTQLLFDELLLAVREVNPRQYERYQAQFYGDSTASIPTPQIPHNLPPRSEFVGRGVEKTRIHEALRSRYFLIGIDGIGGIGKTSLALEVAYECLHASQGDDASEGIVTFDSFVWTTAKDRDLSLNALLDAIAQTLDYPGIVQRPLDQKRLAVEKLLRAQPSLLLVDNFETVADKGVWDFLRNLPEPSKALITTREQKLSHVWPVTLKGLKEAEALVLIRGEGHRLDLESILHADEKTLVHLHTATGGAPLALKWAVGQIKQRGQSLDAVLAALHEARGSIFENMFARSWSLLSPNAQRVLMAMPLFATAASRESIEAASDVHHYALDEVMEQLIEMSLLEVTGELELDQQRYNIHPLTRSFANARLDETPDLADVARSRLAHYYVEHCPQKGLWGHTEGFPWLEAELPTIRAILEWADATSQWNTVTSIFDGIYYFLGTVGYWDLRTRYDHMALKAAQMTGDSASEALCYHAHGWILQERGQYKEAEQYLQCCVELYLKLGRNQDAVYPLVTLAEVALGEGDLGRAQNIVEKAAEMAKDFRSEDFPDGLYARQAEIALHFGDLQKAEELMKAALQVIKGQGRSPSVNSRYIGLGRIALAQGDLGKAEKYFLMGLKSSEEYMRRDNIARARLGLARVYAATSEKSKAIDLLSDAREQFNRLGMNGELAEAEDLLARLTGRSE